MHLDKYIDGVNPQQLQTNVLLASVQRLEVLLQDDEKQIISSGSLYIP